MTFGQRILNEQIEALFFGMLRVIVCSPRSRVMLFTTL